MTTSFRHPFVVITRVPGKWIDGHYYEEMEGVPKNVMMTIQMPSAGDREAIDALNYGRRAARYIKIYTDQRLNAVSQEPMGSPGDFILFGGTRYLIIGEANFNMYKLTNANARVAHYRYYAAEAIEGSAPTVEPA